MDSRIVKRGSHYFVPTRGVVVIDKGLADIGKELAKLNIIVVTTDAISDEMAKEAILPLRIFITRRSGKFIPDASSFEYGIFAIDKIRTKNCKLLARRISQEIVKYGLWNKRHGYILRLKEKSKCEYEELIG